MKKMNMNMHDEDYPCVVGGTSTYSKGAFAGRLPHPYPALLDYADGAYVWGEERRFIDWTGSLGANILGHNNKTVRKALRRWLKKEAALAFGLPNVLEEEVADLILCHTYGQQLRFCKNGSDATEAAVRLARHVTKKRRILTTGYHGSHSDVVGATAGKSGGVLGASLEYVWPVQNEEELVKCLRSDVAAVLTEPIVRGRMWNWEHIKEECDRVGTLFIFDEIITGFRATLGSYYPAVVPDLSCFGKALANGLPLACVMGPRSLMQHFEKDVFFSGTASGELLSLVACQATLEELAWLDSEHDWYGWSTEQGVLLGQALDGLVVGYPQRWTLDLALSEQEDRFRVALAARGVLVGKDFFINAAMTEEDIEMTLEAIHSARREVGI